MAFTVKCEECGTEKRFENGDKARNEPIDFEIYMSSDYQPYPKEITIFCESPKCNHSIDLEY